MIGIKKSIIELPRYAVTQDMSVVKLNQNESPYDLPDELKNEILEKLRQTNWNRYPSATVDDLKNTIAAYTNYPSLGIVVGNGSNEIIQAIFLAICETGDRIVVVSPGFAIYNYLAKIMGLQIIEVPLIENFEFDRSSIIDNAKDAKITVLASPNNPTGTTLSIEDIEKLIKNTEAMVVIDEAYLQFYKKTAQHLIERYENLIIVRTFSKAFGLAGIRLGYLLAQEEIAEQIEKAKLPFSVGIFQQIAGEVTMKNRNLVDNTVSQIIKERDKLFTELNKIPRIKPILSSANFILFELKENSAKRIFDELYKRGVLVRYFAKPRLTNMLRVTIGKPEENRIFLENLKELFNYEQK